MSVSITRTSFVVLAMLLACSDNGTGPQAPAARVPTSIRLNEHVVTLNDSSEVQLVATIIDQNGLAYTTPPAGMAILWSSDDAAIASVDPFGMVRANRPGQTRISATAGTLRASAEVTVRAVPRALEVSSGDGQQGTAGTLLRDSIAVRVVDRHGGGVPQVPVQFAVTAGGGSVGSANVTTSAAGHARTTWILGLRAGENILTASVAGLTPVTINATGSAGGPATLAIHDGDGQSAPAGTAVAIAPSVLVRDVNDNPVPGIPVTFSVTRGGGTAREAAPTTNTAGVASVGSWTLGLVAGANELSATVQGLAPLTFRATATMPLLSIAAGNGQTARMLGALPVRPAAKLIDSSGNPRPGVVITFAVETGAGTLSLTSAATGADGIATAGVWTLGPTPGEQTVSASAPGIPAIIFRANATGTIVPFNASVVEAGETHTCAVDSTTGTAYCWGNNQFGHLGDGTSADRRTPTRVSGAFTFSRVEAGALHSCGLTPSGTAYCWGGNGAGQLGDGSKINRSTPVAVLGGLSFASLSVGSGYTCGVTIAGDAYCWGSNLYGRLGDGTQISRSTPTPVAGGLKFSVVAAGKDATCGLTTTGAAYCWGLLGTGNSPTPVGGGFSFTALAVGELHACALTSSGAAFCWGRNDSGQLGPDAGNFPPGAVAVSGSLVFTGIAAGWHHTCALANSGSIYCWGYNSEGQLGMGSMGFRRPNPTLVVGGLTATALTATGYHTCARAATNALYCWGRNSSGQLGDGTTTDRAVPTQVVRIEP